MEVQIISKEMVKPSSPTPRHLQIYEFSILDQISASYYYPTVLYFLPGQDSNSSGKIHILKESLSSNLTRFYPFSGIINDDLSVKCTDEGIPFFIAKVRGNLQDFLSQPDSSTILKFLPVNYLSCPSSPGDHVYMIQVNCFECGGLALSILVSHSVADGMTNATFIQGWAAAARSTGEEISPKFIGQNLFPSIGAIEKKSKLYPHYMHTLFKSGKFVTRRYLFDASVIAKLKERATSSDSSVTDKPTSVVVVSAFIWKCFMELFADKSNLEQPSLLAHQVNLRRRADPALPDESFGNFLWMTTTNCIHPTTDTNFKDLVNEVNRAIRKIDSEFVKDLQNNGYYDRFEETKKSLVAGPNCLVFTSWCKFGLYDVDFGWGKPIWLSSYVTEDSESTTFSHFVNLMDTRSCDGIEAWVILHEDYAAAFEENEDLQNHDVLVDPSPWQIGTRR